MHCLYLDTLYYLAGAWLAWVPKIPVLRANSFLQLQHAQNCSLLLLFEQNTILWILYVWSMCSDKNCWGWGWNRNCVCHNVSIFNRPKKNSNTTHFIQGFQSSFTLSPFKLSGQAAKFKFESTCEPLHFPGWPGLHIIWQSLIITPWGYSWK